jgi:hypothetical protein
MYIVHARQSRAAQRTVKSMIFIPVGSYYNHNHSHRLYCIHTLCRYRFLCALYCTVLNFKATECKHGRVDCVVGLDPKRWTMDHIPSSTRSRGESNKLTEINTIDLDSSEVIAYATRVRDFVLCWSADSLLLSASPGTFRRGYRFRSH